MADELATYAALVWLSVMMVLVMLWRNWKVKGRMLVAWTVFGVIGAALFIWEDVEGIMVMGTPSRNCRWVKQENKVRGESDSSSDEDFSDAQEKWEPAEEQRQQQLWENNKD